MIVVCEGCERRFQVDAARIPSEGARVRCKRCGHRFRVTPGGETAPAAPAGEATTPGAAAPAAPGELHFVTEPPAGHRGAASAEGAAAAPGERTAASWEFGESIFKLEGAGGEAEAAPSLELAGEGEGEDAAAAAPGGEPVGAAPGAETGAEAVADVEGDATAEVEADAADEVEADAAAGVEADAAAEVDAPAVRLDRAADQEAPVASDEAPADQAEPDAAAADPFAWDEGDDDLDAGLDAAFDLDLPAPPAAAVAPAAPRARGETPAWMEHAGWIAALVLLAALAHGAVRVAPAPATPPAGAASVAEGLSAENVRGRFVENAAGATLFRVSGELRNRGASAAASGRPLRLVLLDARGRAVADTAVGPALPEAAVRESPAEALVARQQRDAGALAGAAVAPGEGIAFDAVVPALPEAAVRFRIETGGSG